MTDYAEEQSSELETLRCIYTGGEFNEVDANCFTIHVEPASTDEDEYSVSVDIQFSYPPTYPDIEPVLEIVAPSGLSSEQCSELESYLKEQATENIGMVMIFTLVSVAQDKLVELMDAKQKEQDEEKLRKELEIKRQEEARFHGTTVTIESFLQWRDKFDKELRESSKQKIALNTGSKLTGRKMFEQDASLASSDTRFLTETSSVVGMGDKDVEVDESLFQDMDDIDIDDET